MTLPPFVLEDSSEDRNIINVNYDIIDTEEGYELILYPLSSINEIGNLIAPMSIGTMILDYHYYLRNSNGSCQNGCGGNCSEWSHKDGHDKVYNTPPKFNQNLCDSNLATYAFNLTPEFALANAYTFLANKTDIRYYYITKDTKVYNSWHGDPTTYATPYYSN